MIISIAILFFFSYYFFAVPFIIYAVLVSLPPVVVTQIRDHIYTSTSRLFFPPAATVRALHFYREKISALSSLVDSPRRLASKCAYPFYCRRSQHFPFIFTNKTPETHNGGIVIGTPGRRHQHSRVSTIDRLPERRTSTYLHVVSVVLVILLFLLSRVNCSFRIKTVEPALPLAAAG